MLASLNPALSLISLAGTRFESVMRLSLKRPFLVFPQMCVKPRNRNVSGLPRPRAARSPGGVSAELDQPCLLGIQLQTELREPVAKLDPEPFGVLPMLEPHHGSSANLTMTTSPRAFRPRH